jgi:hypothetical protein
MMPRSAHAVCNPIRCIVNRPSYAKRLTPDFVAELRHLCPPCPALPGPQETDPHPEILVISGPETSARPFGTLPPSADHGRHVRHFAADRGCSG